MKIDDAKNEIESILANIITGTASTQTIRYFKEQRFNTEPPVTTERLLQLLEDAPTFAHCPQTLLMEICAEVSQEAKIQRAFSLKLRPAKSMSSSHMPPSCNFIGVKQKQNLW